MNNKIIKIIVLFTFTILPFVFSNFAQASPNTYYVSPAGNDNNDGLTPDTAFSTIQEAADTAVAGDTVEVQAGIYNESILIATSGKKEQPITYQAKDKVIIYAQKSFAFKLDSADYINIQDFIFCNVKDNGIIVKGKTNTHNVFKDNNHYEDIFLAQEASFKQVNLPQDNNPPDTISQIGSPVPDNDIDSSTYNNETSSTNSVTNIPLDTYQNINNNINNKNHPSTPVSSSEVSIDEEDNKKIISFEHLSNEIIVKFKPAVKSQLSISVRPKTVAMTNLPSIDKLNRKFKVKAIKRIFKDRKPKKIKANKIHKKLPDLSTIYKFKLPEKVSIFQAINEYKKDPNVEYVEPNYIAKIFATYPNDPSFPDQWALNNTGQTGGTEDADIDTPEAWNITTGSSNTVIAVIDTGVDLDHPDLVSNIWQNTDEIPSNNIDDDYNGFIDDINGWDFYNKNNDPMDDNKHGTHVSGIASAVTNNGVGVAGVSWNSKLMAVKVLSSDGSGPYSDVANGIVYAADNGADVINMSLGGGADSRVLKDAVNYAYGNNCIIVAAAGNLGDSIPLYPAAYDNVVSVAATDHDDERASFSTYGQEVDVAAPGVNIYNTMWNDGYGASNGTSTAAPHVSGIAALILSDKPSATNDEVRKIIYICAEDLGDIGWDKYTGFGRVNAFKALTSDGLSYLFARIRSPRESDLFSKSITITGTAAGSNFSHYEVSVGRGKNPTSWETTGITLTGGEVVDGVLATWDCSSFENDIWTIKLISYDVDLSTKERTIYVSIDNSYQQGWPQETMYGGASYNASIVAGDVDNDGTLEVVTGSYEGNVYIWRYDGTLLEGWPVYIGGQALTPALADLDGDGDLEIAIGINSSYDANLFIFHHNGDPFEGDWPKGGGSEYGYEINYISDAPTVADIDGDGDYEILIGGEDWKIHAWHHDGTVVSGWPADLEHSQNATAVAVGDIDGDGDVEIVAAESSSFGTEIRGNIYAWHHDGTVVSGWPIDVDGTLYQPVLGDINGDGKLEVIVSSRAGIFAFKGDGTFLSGWPKYLGINKSKIPCLGDLNNDNIPEVILLTDDDTINAWYGNGSNVPGWPRTFGYAWFSGAVVADVDDDGDKEVIMAIRKSGTDSHLYIFNHDGTFADGYPKETDIDYFSIPVIIDLDKDGDVEIIAHGEYQGTLGVNVYVWDLQGLYNKDKMDWPMIGRNARHTACYPIAPGSISGKVLLQARENHSETITFELRNPGETIPLETHQILTANDGSYTLRSISPGIYDLTAKTSNSLRAKQSDIIVSTNQTTPSIDFSLLGGDANNDNFIDSTDVSILSATYYKGAGEDGFNEKADFNNDNFVDSTDVSILSSNYYTGGEK